MIVPDSLQRYWNVCEQFLRRRISERVVFFGCFAFVYGYLMFVLLIPMILQNAMMMWDHAGLYFSTWYEKEYVFPGVFAWNPYFYAGYAHNQFYPPLYSYLAAALSQFFSVTVSLRMMLAVTMLLTPLSCYAFARALRFSKEKAAVAMLAMFALLFLFPTTYYGGNLSSTFKIGLVTHAFGLMLFFFYAASLMRAKETGKHLLPTLLFAALILSHLIAAIVAGVMLLAFLLLYAKDRGFRKFLYWHAGLTFLLTAFWTLPFLAKKQHMTVIYLANNGQLQLLSLIAVLYALFLFFAKQKREKQVMYPVALFLLMMLAFALAGDAFLSFSFHFYRLYYFILLMLPVIACSLYATSRIWNLVLVLSALVIIVTSIPVSTVGPALMETQAITMPLEGRTFIVAPYDAETAPHLLQHLIPVRERIFAVKGLYIESTRNGEYLLNFEKELDPDHSLSWGNLIYSEYILRNNSLVVDILPEQLSLFQINFAVIPEDLAREEWQKMQEVARYGAGEKKRIYALYRVGNASLSEVVMKPLRVVPDKDWKQETLAWFFSPAIKKEMLVDTLDSQILGSVGDSVEVLEQGHRQDYVRLNVNAEKEVPVLVKISYFPNWKAYQEGREIPVYRTAPDLMLVYGKGEIELKYEELPIDTLGKWLSFLGAVIFAVMLVRSFAGTRGKKKERY